MPKRQPEQDLQISIAAELRLNMPRNVPWTAVESSGRGARDGARQKSKGVNPSWADLQFVIPPLGTYLGIELKADADNIRGVKKGYLTKEQKEFRDKIKAVGGLYHIARSMQEVWSILAEYGVRKGRFSNDNALKNNNNIVKELSDGTATGNSRPSAKSTKAKGGQNG